MTSFARVPSKLANLRLTDTIPFSTQTQGRAME